MMKFAFRSVAVGFVLLVANHTTVAQDIILGQSIDLTGPTSGLGKEYAAGAAAYFDGVNAAGGVKGKKIVLKTLDDGYKAARTEANTKQFLQDPETLALFGYLGTPTSAVAIPLASGAKVPYFGAYTGAELLRKPTNRYVFNVRASYLEETELLVKQLTADGVTKFAVVYNNDAFGQSGLAGINNALEKRKIKLLGSASTEIGSTDLTKALDTIAPLKPEAVVMITAVGGCAAFIKGAKAKGIYARIATISTVQPLALAKALGPEASGTIMSQVVPSPWSERHSWVTDYQKAMKARNEPYSYIGLEGYLAARIIVDALRRGGDASRESLIRTLEGMREVEYSGFRVAFGPNDRNGSSFVELITLDKTGKIRY
jgi:branched-chain amino acid transport system substrate-binding protein